MFFLAQAEQTINIVISKKANKSSLNKKKKKKGIVWNVLLILYTATKRFILVGLKKEVTMLITNLYDREQNPLYTDFWIVKRLY